MSARQRRAQRASVARWAWAALGLVVLLAYVAPALLALAVLLGGLGAGIVLARRWAAARTSGELATRTAELAQARAAHKSAQGAARTAKRDAAEAARETSACRRELAQARRELTSARAAHALELGRVQAAHAELARACARASAAERRAAEALESMHAAWDASTVPAPRRPGPVGDEHQAEARAALLTDPLSGAHELGRR